METQRETVCLIDCAAGIYIPRNFFEHFDLSSWGLNINDYSELSDPENEFYWETWEELLKNAQHFDENGKMWRLEQDDSLFAVCEDAGE